MIVDQVYGRLTILSEAEPHRMPSGKPRRRFLCRCECGKEKVVHLSRLRIGHTRSCGCLQREKAIERNFKHGYKPSLMNGSKMYYVWSGMKARCLNPRHEAYKNYGGRGITVCDRWLDFKNFLADMGEAPKGLTLERIDNNGNYEPANCRWATRIEQANNSRRHRKPIWYKGGFISIKEFAKIVGVSAYKIRKMCYRTKIEYALQDI